MTLEPSFRVRQGGGASLVSLRFKGNAIGLSLRRSR
jgi:hypothetical protein